MLLIGVVSLAAACGTAPRAVAIDAQTQQQLTADVEAVKAAQQDRKAAEDALTTLTSHVAAAQATGHLNATQAQSILAAADRIRDDVRTMPTPTPATVVLTVPPATTAPQQPGANNDGENNQGNNKLGKRKG
jgi:hypothetical protein